LISSWSGQLAWSSGTGLTDRPRSRRYLAVGGAAVVAHHAQHVLGVRLVAREGAELAGHLGRGRVGNAGHDRGQRAADGAAFVGVIGNAGGHQQAADIGEAEAERAVLVGLSSAISLDGNCAIITEISSTMVQSRTACS
jgi:hypothetical protein